LVKTSRAYKEAQKRRGRKTAASKLFTTASKRKE